MIDTAALARHTATGRSAQLPVGDAARHFQAATTPESPCPRRRAGHRGRASRSDRARGKSRRAHHRGPAGVRSAGVATAAREARLGAICRRPGVYLFVAEHEETRHVLYVGSQEHPQAGTELLHRRREALPDRRDGAAVHRSGGCSLPNRAPGRCRGAPTDRPRAATRSFRAHLRIKITRGPFPDYDRSLSVRDDTVTSVRSHTDRV